MEPPHIHFYRALGLMLFLPDLEKQTPAMYAASLASRGDGLVSEAFGCTCGTCPGTQNDLDRGHGDARGDDNPVFLLDVFANWKWGIRPRSWLHAAPVAKATLSAIEFMLGNAPAPFNLTYRMVNTNDEHGIIVSRRGALAPKSQCVAKFRPSGLTGATCCDGCLRRAM